MDFQFPAINYLYLLASLLALALAIGSRDKLFDRTCMLWFFVAIHYAGLQHWLSTLAVIDLLLVPLSTLLLVAMLQWHSLFYERSLLVPRNYGWVLQFGSGIAFRTQFLLCSCQQLLARRSLVQGIALVEQLRAAIQDQTFIYTQQRPQVMKTFEVFERRPEETQELATTHDDLQIRAGRRQGRNPATSAVLGAGEGAWV
jgi:hypothetical protein